MGYYAASVKYDAVSIGYDAVSMRCDAASMVIGSQHFEVMQCPNLQRSKCPRRMITN
jgi:hypothetical protein